MNDPDPGMQPEALAQENPLGGQEMQFTNPEDELAFLRKRLTDLESKISLEDGHVDIEIARGQIAHQLVEAYDATPGVQVIDPAHQIPEQVAHEISLNLKPEEHDSQIEQLYAIMLQKGVKNAMNVLRSMNSPHLTDDFHRFLVQYLIAMGDVPGVKHKDELYKSVNMSLFEVTLPRPEDDERKTFKEFIAMMEQFYAGMQSIALGDPMSSHIYTVELALAAGTDQVVFYVSIPNDKIDLFEKQVLGIFADARVEPAPDDYNIFADNSVAIAAVGQPTFREILSMKTYDQFESDPIDVLLNVFSKLDTHSEGAAVQFVIAPAQESFIKEYAKALEKIQKGQKIDDALKNDTFMRGMGDFFVSEEKKDKRKQQLSERIVDQKMVELIQKKLSSAIMETNIRIIASAPTDMRAREMVRDAESAFNQFSEPQGNGIQFQEVHPKKLQDFFRSFSFRMFEPRYAFRINIKELATVFHFPGLVDTAPQLKQAQAATSPAPLDMPTEGLFLGWNKHRGKKTPIFAAPEDRFRHYYVVGQTGTGKSGSLLSMVVQDMHAGRGVCYIDPHGSDVNTLLSWVPEHRQDDVIYFDPAYIPRPMGLNMLEFDQSRPEQITLVIDELMGIFNQLFDMKAQGGAMFQQYFKNSAMLTMGHPESGNTLLEITRVLGDSEFRKMKLGHCANPIVRQFWANAEKTTGDQSLANFVPYISSKFDPLISNEILRPVITQQHSAFNMREVMDKGKILLVNLSKGRLGELNSNLIGLILVGKIQMAALGRADSYGQEHKPFYLYIDEFQNVTTPSIASILSEARKYKLSLTMAHQFLAQLDDDIKNAVMGNVGSMQVFRISSEDAKVMEPRVAPSFTAEDITKLDNRNAYMSLLVNGQPASPFNMVTADWDEDLPPRNQEIIEPLKELSYMRYGRERAEVEAEIMAKYDQINKNEETS